MYSSHGDKEILFDLVQGRTAKDNEQLLKLDTLKSAQSFKTSWKAFWMINFDFQ